MIAQLQELILRLNASYTIDPMIINMLTGIIVSIILLAMRNFKFTPSSKFRWSKLLFHSGSFTLLTAIVVNRLASFPPSYPATSLIYMVAYLLFFGYILYAGSAWAARSIHANQTFNSTKNAEPLS